MLNPIVHKEIMTRVLKDIYADAAVGPALGFKGGTAAFLFYHLPRFSVDLDFDLLNQEKEDDLLARLPEILGKYGVVREAVKKRFTLFFLLSYKKGQRSIKVEISRRYAGSGYEVKTFLGIPMRVMKLPDMAAGKLAALLTRVHFASRDVFDLWYFLDQQWEINDQVLKEKTGWGRKAALRRAIKLVEKIDSAQLLKGLGELVNQKQKNWIKTKLKNEILFLLKLNLDLHS